MKTIGAGILGLLLLASCGSGVVNPLPGTEIWELEVEGTTRHALVHPPADRSDGLPVLLCFHGGYGTARGMERSYGLTAAAEREGFIAVYPQGLGRHWKDGRIDPGDLRDVEFTQVLLDSLFARFQVDSCMVYATGMSNGAFFCHFLAEKLPGVLAGIAPVCGGIADPGYQWFSPERSMDVCIIQATDDPMVPFCGGEVGRDRGKVLPTGTALEMWREVNGTVDHPVVTELPDLAPEDGCTCTSHLYTGIRDVMLVEIAGGGHAWPGSDQYLPVSTIGRLCEDFNASDLIWRFFMDAAERKENEGDEIDTDHVRSGSGAGGLRR